MTPRARLILVMFLGLPAMLWAQKQQDSWSDLRGLRAGQGIEVIESSMKHHSGEFIDVTDEVLTLPGRRIRSVDKTRRRRPCFDILRRQARRACRDRPCSRRGHWRCDWRLSRFEPRFLGGIFARNRGPRWHCDWRPKRGPSWRRDPRSHNRLSRRPGRRAQDGVASEGVTSSFIADGVPNCNQTRSHRENSMTQRCFCCGVVIVALTIGLLPARAVNAEGVLIIVAATTVAAAIAAVVIVARRSASQQKDSDHWLCPLGRERNDYHRSRRQEGLPALRRNNRY